MFACSCETHHVSGVETGPGLGGEAATGSSCYPRSIAVVLRWARVRQRWRASQAAAPRGRSLVHSAACGTPTQPAGIPKSALSCGTLRADLGRNRPSGQRFDLLHSNCLDERFRPGNSPARFRGSSSE